MSYKPFKMKGHSLPGINQRKADKTADGRPGSSALQMKTDAELAAADQAKRAKAERQQDGKGTTDKERSAMKNTDNRSFYQKAKDEAKQIGKGLKSGILELDNIGSGEHTGKSIKPVKAFKRAYKEEENKQAKKRKAGSQSLTKKN